MSPLAEKAREIGMSPEMTEAIGMTFLKAAAELRAGPRYAANDGGAEMLETVMAVSGTVQ